MILIVKLENDSFSLYFTDRDLIPKVILNETDSSLVNGFIFDVSQLPSVFCENYESECESVDDSIKDPNYSAIDSQSSTNDANEEESMTRTHLTHSAG